MKTPQINDVIIVETKEQWYLIQEYLFTKRRKC